MTPPASPPTPLRIAVVGVGAIGSTFAFQLARAGQHDVTAVARPGSPRLAQLQRDGGIVNRAGERADVRVADALDESIAYDLVLVTVLAHQVDAILPALRRSAAAHVQLMFNTFDPERLRDAVGAERCGLGMPFVQATIGADGALAATIGAAGQKTKLDQPRWVEVFRAAGLPAVLEPEMARWLRCHAPLCVAFESVSVAGVGRGGGGSWAEAMTLARGVHACFALIQQLGGGAVYPSGKAWMNRLPPAGVASMLWFLSRIRSFRELLAQGAAESCAIVDAMVAAAPPGFAADQLDRIRAMKPSQRELASASASV